MASPQKNPYTERKGIFKAMANKRGDILPSDTISDFLDFLDDVIYAYDENAQAEDLEDKRLQDLLHELEFSKNAKERNKVATKFAKSRQKRRIAKDERMMLEKIVDFCSIKENKDCIKRMRKLLNDQRIQEQMLLGERSYHPRVTEDI